MLFDEMLPHGCGGLDFVLSRALFRIIDKVPGARLCRTPCAVLFEFVAKIGFEVSSPSRIPPVLA